MYRNKKILMSRRKKFNRVKSRKRRKTRPKFRMMPLGAEWTEAKKKLGDNAVESLTYCQDRCDFITEFVLTKLLDFWKQSSWHSKDRFLGMIFKVWEIYSTNPIHQVFEQKKGYFAAEEIFEWWKDDPDIGPSPQPDELEPETRLVRWCWGKCSAILHYIRKELNEFILIQEGFQSITALAEPNLVARIMRFLQEIDIVAKDLTIGEPPSYVAPFYVDFSAKLPKTASPVLKPRTYSKSPLRRKGGGGGSKRSSFRVRRSRKKTRRRKKFRKIRLKSRKKVR